MFFYNFDFFTQKLQETSDSEIPIHFVIGSKGHPLLPWLIKEHRGDLTPVQKQFNVWIQYLRQSSIEYTFKRLKARWAILINKINSNPVIVSEIISACCILHNFVELNKEQFLNEWLSNVNVGQLKHEQPEPAIADTDYDDADGICAQNYLTTYVSIL